MQYLYNVDVTSYAGKSRTNYNFNGEAQPAEGSGESGRRARGQAGGRRCGVPNVVGQKIGYGRWATLPWLCC